MRLRQLKYPIAILQPTGLIGGKNAGLARTCRFDVILADYYLGGAFDEAIILDATGGEYDVVSIDLRPISLWARAWQVGNRGLELAVCAIARLLGFRWKAMEIGDLARVDMVLKKRRQLSLDAFCKELREIALAHPEWWRGHSKRAEIEAMFEGCTSFKTAINDIGVLERRRQPKPPGFSRKTVDHR